MMRWLGYPMILETQRSLVAKIDVDESGLLDKTEFMKLMRSLREDELARLQVQFDRYDRDGSGSLSVEGPELRDVLRGMGHLPTKQMIQEAIAASHEEGAAEIDFDGFVRMMKEYRIKQVADFRKNYGFPDKEVQRLRGKFGKYDRDHSGELEQGEIVRLLEEIFPKAKTNDAESLRIKRLMEEADKDGSGTLNFYDFLAMMRQYHDEKDEEYLRKEEAAVLETGFSKDEVDQFKEIYNSADKYKSGELSFQEVRAMLSVVIPSGVLEEQVKELTEILCGCDEDGNRETDFPEFLILMKKVQNVNFAEINERSEKVAKRLSLQAESAAGDAASASLPRRPAEA